MPSIKFIIQIFFLILIDQITKAYFAHRDFFLGFMRLHLVKNFGLSFGLNLGQNLNGLILVVAVVLFLLFLRNQKISFATALIAAGAISNILDRIFIGYVRDFWDIGLGFTFNVADLFILLGLILLLFKPSSPKTFINQDQIAK